MHGTCSPEDSYLRINILKLWTISLSPFAKPSCWSSDLVSIGQSQVDWILSWAEGCVSANSTMYIQSLDSMRAEYLSNIAWSWGARICVTGGGCRLWTRFNKPRLFYLFFIFFSWYRPFTYLLQSRDGGAIWGSQLLWTGPGRCGLLTC